jgi:hypothetical protein
MKLLNEIVNSMMLKPIVKKLLVSQRELWLGTFLKYEEIENNEVKPL